MHIFIECSIPLEGEDEGYGEKRLCHDCAKNGNVQNSIDLGQENKENSHRKKITYRQAAKYLGERKNDIKDILQWNRNRTIPIIKNDNSLQLAPVTIDNKTVLLRNTCSFDSILCLALLAPIDFINIRNKVSS